MRTAISTILFFCLLPAGRAQSGHLLDSLRTLARTTGSDTARVWALMEAGKLFFDRQPDSALYYLDQALALAEKTGFERGVIRCKINTAYVAYDKARYDEAIGLCADVLPRCERLGMYKELAAAANTIANCWNTKGNHWLAIDYYERSLAAMKRAEMPPHFPIVVHTNLAILFNDLHLYPRAATYCRESIELARALGDEAAEGTAQQNLGTALQGLGHDEEALAAYRRAVELGRKLDYTRLLATALGNVADLVSARGETAEARRLYEEALAIARETDDRYNLMLSLHGLSLLALEQRDLAAARRYTEQALETGRDIDVDDYTFAVLLTRSDIALADGDMAGWRRYRQQYFRRRDTLVNQGLVHALEELETRYETEKKEQQIRQLEREREVQQLRLTQKNRLFTGASALALMTLLTGTLGYRQARARKRVAEQEVLLQQQRIRELEREKQLSAIDAMLRGQEAERGRLARDLHDGLGGMLSGIKQSLFAMKGTQILPETAARALPQVINDLDRSIEELRHIARNMMPEALVRYGLHDALRDYCDHLRAGSHLAVHFQSFGLEAHRLPPSMEIVLFRIAQELLNNVVRHARATEVLLQLIRDGDRLHLTVEDNGRGFDPQALKAAPGVGWVNIRSRVDYLKGALDLRSAPGQGASISIECPIHDPDLPH